MAAICPKCGAVLKGQVKFCENCGAPVASAQPSQPACTPPTQPVYAQPVAAPDSFAGNGKVRQGIPVPGFSDRVNHPEILSSVKKNRKASSIFGLILVPLPLIGFIIYSAVSKEMELGQAALYGAIVSVVFLVFALVSRFRQRESASYEGVVTDKKTRERSDSKGDDRLYYTEYITYVRTSDGKNKKIVERDGGLIVAYNYLDIGDRFRYHPQFNFPYELYDKRKAPYIGCVSCGSHNPIENDRCSRCNTPMLK